MRDKHESSILDHIWTKNVSVKAKATVDSAVCLRHSLHRPVNVEIMYPNTFECKKIQYKKIICYEQLEIDVVKKLWLDEITPDINNLNIELQEKLNKLKDGNLSKNNCLKDSKTFNTEVENTFNNLIISSLEKICGTKFVGKQNLFINENKVIISLTNKLNTSLQ